MNYKEWERNYYRQEQDFKKVYDKIIWLLGFLLSVAIIGIVSFLPFSFVFWIISKCFSFSFSWKASFGAWLVFKIIQAAFKKRD